MLDMPPLNRVDLKIARLRLLQGRLPEREREREFVEQFSIRRRLTWWAVRPFDTSLGAYPSN